MKSQSQGDFASAFAASAPLWFFCVGLAEGAKEGRSGHFMPASTVHETPLLGPVFSNIFSQGDEA